MGEITPKNEGFGFPWTERIRPGSSPIHPSIHPPLEEMPPELTSLVGLRDDGTTPEPTVAGMAIGFQVCGGEKVSLAGEVGWCPQNPWQNHDFGRKTRLSTIKTYQKCRPMAIIWEIKGIKS